MKLTDKTKRLLSFVLTLLLLFPTVFKTVTKAVTLSESDQQKIDDYKSQQEILNKKIEESKQKISEMENDIEHQRAYVNELSEQIRDYQDMIDSLQEDIDVFENEKAKIQKKIDELDEQIEEINVEINHNELDIINIQQQTEDVCNELKDCLCDIYMNGTSSELELLLSSKDFSSFLITLELSADMAKRDEELVNTLNLDIARINELEEKQRNLIVDIEAKKAELDKQIKELDDKESVIVASRDEQENAKSAIDTLYAEAMEYMQVLDKTSDAYAQLVKNYEAEIEEFERKIDAIVNQASHGTGTVSASGLIWPLQYSDVYISSGYGYRSDPATGSTRFHAGVDSCCWSGTYGKNISAAAAGTVIISTWHSSYGYYVGIDHGNGVVTIYAHNSQLLVSVGEYVEQGQTIAYAGATGYATGAHCHFEVRINGEKMNALNYCSP